VSKRFTSHHKIAVLALLDANGGSVSLTASQCGISERTLYAWKKERAQLQSHAHELQQSPSLLQQPEEMQEEDEISLLRDYVMQSALRIAAGLSRELDSPILFHKVNALNGLLDRLTKLEKQFPTANPANMPVLRIEYVDEYGRTYDSPPDGIELDPIWNGDDDDEEDE
jgi:transposase-like protein